MRRRFVRALMALGLLLGVAAAGQAQDGLPRITQREFKALFLEDKVLVVDVRDPESFAEGHIPGAINVPETTERRHLDTLKASKKAIVTYCA